MTVVKLVPQDFELVSGNDKNLNFSVLDQDDVVVDLTGATIAWSMSRTNKSKSELITLLSPADITITDPVNGKFTVTIKDTDSEALQGGDYYHEARVTSTAGLKTTVAYGTVELLDNIIDT